MILKWTCFVTHNLQEFQGTVNPLVSLKNKHKFLFLFFKLRKNLQKNLQTNFIACLSYYSLHIFRLPLLCVLNVTADRSSDYPCHVSQILQLTNLQTTPDVSQILQMTNLQTILAVCPKYYIDKSSNYPRCVSQILQMTNLQTILVVCPKYYR